MDGYTLAGLVVALGTVTAATFKGVAAIVREYYWGRATLIRAEHETQRLLPPPR